MPNNSAIVVFTAKSADRIIREGGTSSWRLDRNNARRCEYAVCVRNAHSDWGDGEEQHHAAFLVGKISAVIPTGPTPGNNEAPENRFLIVFSEYANVDVPDCWPKGYRNPVRYSNLAELAINPETLQWHTMPEATAGPSIEEDITLPVEGNSERLTIMQAKKGLGLTFGISPDAVEIIIRG